MDPRDLACPRVPFEEFVPILGFGGLDVSCHCHFVESLVCCVKWGLKGRGGPMGTIGYPPHRSLFIVFSSAVVRFCPFLVIAIFGSFG